MALPVQKFRELVFQMLYSYDIGKPEDQDIMDLLSHELAVTHKSTRDAQLRCQLIFTHLKEIDALIAKTSLSYEFERIQTVERNILRLAIFEILFDENKDIPYKVSIAEALRLARKFSTKESASFINAILDAVYKASRGEVIDPNQITEATQELVEIEELHKKHLNNLDNNITTS